MNFAAFKAEARRRNRERQAAIRQLVAVTTTAKADQPVYLDPVEYAREVLGITLTDKQAEICRALREQPWRVLVTSGNNLGKTHLAAVLVCWWFDTFRENSAVITTAPSAQHIRSVLWGYIRTFRARKGLPGFQSRAVDPELRDAPDHYAVGLSTDKEERLKGRHFRHMLFIIDESVGVDAWVFQAIRTMFQSDGRHAWLVLCNPTDTTSQTYAESQAVGADEQPLWRVIALSALDHPNVHADLHERGRKLAGLPPLDQPRIGGAVSLAMLEDWLAVHTDPLPAADANATDLQWPPEWWRGQYAPDAPPKWFRPSGDFEAEALGRWPSESGGSVWSQAAWEAACVRKGELDADGNPYVEGVSTGERYFSGEIVGHGELKELVVISCDPAGKGANKTDIKVGTGIHVLHTEEHSGWMSPQCVGRLKELARDYAKWCTARRHPNAAPIRPDQIRVVVDSDGLGAYGVIDHANPGWQQEFQFVPISAGSPPLDPARYVNKRSELWFHAVMLARTGKMDLSRLPKKALAKMRLQAMSPEWKFDGMGHRVVETKQHMMERGVVSPDSMDSLNLLFYPGTGTGMTIEIEKSESRSPRPEDADSFDSWGHDDSDRRPAMFRGRRQ